MAIKISGTTVVDNSRNITNANDANFAGIVTATKLVGDGSGIINLGSVDDAKVFFISARK